MRTIETALYGVLLIEPTVFGDERGWFFESWNQTTFDRAIGHAVRFVQDNHSRSAGQVLRGLHYQLSKPQAKLVRCVVGSVWDVAVDLRRSSSSFGRWFGIELSADNRRQLWIPEGFAHGFVVLGDEAEVVYKTSEFYRPEDDRVIRYDDPVLGIQWPATPDERLMSDKDRRAPSIAEAELYD